MPAPPKGLHCEEPAGARPTERHLDVRTTPLRIVAIYVTLGAAWILFSDKLVFALWGEAAVHERLSIAKGWLYVLATAALLYVLIRRNVREVTRLGAQMAKVIENMPDAVLLIDASATVVAANQAAAALIGASSRSELLLPIQQLVERLDVRRPDGTRAGIDGSPVVQGLGGETVRGEALLQRAGGEDLYMSIVSAPVRFDRDGEVSLSVVVIRDMSERRRLEMTRDEFLQVAAHEFKTPLAVIKAYAQLLEKRGEGDPATLRVIHRQVDRLTRLTQQLLEFSRLRLGGPDLRQERYDIAEQLAQVADRVQRSVDNRLRVEPTSAVPVLADRERIEQVLLNLFDNAVKYSPRGGDIEARVERRDGEAVVAIRDHGLGIPREKQARVFERFYRAHAGTHDDYGGIGVGLDTSHGIVARHGGRMWFESEEGLGSTFFFSLPLAEVSPGGRAD